MFSRRITARMFRPIRLSPAWVQSACGTIVTVGLVLEHDGNEVPVGATHGRSLAVEPDAATDDGRCGYATMRRAAHPYPRISLITLPPRVGTWSDAIASPM